MCVSFAARYARETTEVHTERYSHAHTHACGFIHVHAHRHEPYIAVGERASERAIYYVFAVGLGAQYLVLR